MDVKSGRMTSYDPLQPYDPSLSPATAGVTPTVSPSDSPANVQAQLGGVFDAAGQQADIQARGEADASAAQAAAMDARDSMLAGYQAQILPLGGAYGDQVPIPPVPAAAVPPTDTDWYPYGGDEPTPEPAGWDPGT
jgi:hypothetical protein